MFWSLIALATLSMTSCSQDETLEARPQENAIEFGTYLGRDVQTRGTITDNNILEFGVFAFYTGNTSWASTGSSLVPNFMYNQSVSRTAVGSDWTYNPKKYWPTTNGDKITFFAYAPMASVTNGMTVSATNNPGTPTVTYTIDSANLENMADFVADAMIDITKEGSTTLDSKNREVKFELNHELTRVNIQAKLDREAFNTTNTNKTKVNITDVKFIGPKFATSATYTFAQENDDNSTTPITKKRGTWSNFTYAQTPFSIFDTDDASFINKKIDDDLSSASYNQTGVAVPTNNVVNLFNTNQYLFLIPTYGENGIEANTVSMYVTYDIVTIDAALNNGHSKTTTTKEIVLPATLLKQGVAYNIVLTFGLNEIVLSATVSDWVNAGDSHNVDWPKTDK